MSGYDRFFKKVKESKGGGATDKRPASGGNGERTPRQQAAARAAEAASAEAYLRSALKVKAAQPPRRRSMPIVPGLAVLIGIVVAGAGYFFPDSAEKLLNKIEVGAFSLGFAADEPKKSGEGLGGKTEGGANSAETKENFAAGSADGKTHGPGAECPPAKGFTDEELSHFNKLNERKQELDRREAELSLLEEELHKQKSEVESRITKLEQIRGEVANVLKDRVEMDQQRVTTLVDFYSNMKPKQAAEVFSTLNEDLAVEVLGRMKKKNAADILNLLEPAKARALSEKFTGYKRR